YASVERHGIYYDLMMHDLLETRGSFRTERSELSRAQAVELLCAEVSAATGRPRSVVQQALEHGLDQKLLRYSSASGVCSWRFADADASLLVTELVRRAPLLPAQRAPAHPQTQALHETA
ncbi:MAG TPA: hypothetical protein VF331_27315, partial [Polyangiales bacterium]